ncbi:hypothetical protein Ga0074812_14848 [Parafrankia irregularis]|uniref:Protein kilB n=1 Tax=Parafrankia irregularis TaxID=795642 RepID=A0A0S4QYY5_9ACTN|nr:MULTISPECIES: hypothetical protein [Parafrankia]MBE3206772.1 protein kilB [Parafrankia sp. CH37]CUU60848.1 hypothetical protein Ga0074812_14848 [Parafrankia irregularis]
MMEAIIGAGAALLGTLAGGLAQWAAARATRTTAERQARHTAVATLTAALAAHRTAMWVREDARLTGANPAGLAGLRAASHTTRAAITVPLTELCLTAPDLADTARAAAAATYALRHPADHTQLTAAREAALAAERTLVDTAARR